MDLAQLGLDVAKGAAAGSVVPGIGTALGAATGAALNLAPEIGRWLFGADAAPTIAAAQQALTAVTGTPDPEAQVAALEDPTVASAARVRLAEIAAGRAAAESAGTLAMIQAMAADRQDARKTMSDLAAQHSPLAYGAAVVSLLLLLAWFGSLVANYLGAPALGADDSATLRNLAIAVGAYWIGSSAGSAAKDRRSARGQ